MTAPRRNKVALSVLLTKYKAAGLPSTEPISLQNNLTSGARITREGFHSLLDKDFRYAGGISGGNGEAQTGHRGDRWACAVRYILVFLDCIYLGRMNVRY